MPMRMSKLTTGIRVSEMVKSKKSLEIVRKQKKTMPKKVRQHERKKKTLERRKVAGHGE